MAMQDTKGAVLITGCSNGGLGSALALKFHELGYHVFATARDVSKMSSLKDLTNVTFLELDVVNLDHVKAAVDAVAEATGGKLDYLVHMAGNYHIGPILDEDMTDVRYTFETHVFAPINITQAFMPLLMKAKGVVVFVSSLAGHLNISYLGSYAGAKAGLEAIAETLRLEVAPFGVDVLTLVTGGVESMATTRSDNFTLPDKSLYKSLEGIIKDRAQGKDGMIRIKREDYAEKVCEAIVHQRSGKFWYGTNADMVKNGTTNTSIAQIVMDAGASTGTGLDTLGSAE